MRNGPGETKEFVLSIDTSSGACNNIEVVDDGARRPLTTEEYTHLASVYIAAYTSAAYGQHDETWADYWRAYFASIATPTR
jgi:hypothetical protein